MLKFLKTLASAMGYIYTAFKLVILCIKMKRISTINDKIQMDKEIADAIKHGDTEKLAKLIKFYGDGYDKTDK